MKIEGTKNYSIAGDQQISKRDQNQTADIVLLSAPAKIGAERASPKAAC
jgi:hypothetical protein